MKYNTGDKVRVIYDLNSDKWYDDGELCATNDMVELAGTIVTIVDIENGYYKIKEDDGDYSWSDDMFIDQNPTKKSSKKAKESDEDRRIRLLDEMEKSSEPNERLFSIVDDDYEHQRATGQRGFKKRNNSVKFNSRQIFN